MAVPANQILAPKVRDLFFDSTGNYIPSDYKVMRGGRGGLKSWGFARMGVILAAKRKLRIACAREYQSSIDESVHETLCKQIEALKLDPYFDVQKRAILGKNGSEFFFAGIKTDPGKFKSTEGSTRQVSRDFMIYSSEKPFLFLEPEAPNLSRQFLISAERAENIRSTSLSVNS